MLFLGKRFLDLTQGDFDELVSQKVRESQSLEYKLELPGNSNDARKEFLADISCVANSGGGFLFFGIEATDGIASSVPGIAGMPSIDEIKLNLENRLRTGLSPRVKVTIQEFELTSGNFVVGVMIPRSLNAPHMVSFDNTNRFYSRNSAP